MIRDFSGSALFGCVVVLGALLGMSAAGEPADPPVDVEGPILKAPVLNPPEEVEPRQSPMPRLVQPEGVVGRQYVAEEEPKAAAPAAEEPPEAKPEAEPDAQLKVKPEAKPEQKPEAKPELGPEMVALRDRIRRTLALARRQPFNTRDHSVTEILHLCLAFGCEAEVRQGGPSGEKTNAIACLCWNYPCRGQEPLVIADGHIAARIGYGLQTRRSQLLAVLAQSRVPADYPIRVGEDVRKVSDLVEQEKLSCRAGDDASLKLIGLAFYLDDEATWKNSLGQTWSLERLIDEELDRPIVAAPDGGTRRLMGLSHAVRRRVKRKLPVQGVFERARQYTRQFQDFALKHQNDDGSWHPDFPASVGSSRDTAGLLRSTGQYLQWLAFSLPEERLEEPPLVKAVGRVNSLLGSRRYLGSGTALSPLETGAMMHALHALAIYDERVFQPRDPKGPAEEKEAPADQAKGAPASFRRMTR